MPSYRFRWGEPGVIDLSDNAIVPPDPDGWRWKAYLEWMYAGNEALPAIEPPPLPKRISKLLLIQRMTNEEADAVNAARSSVSTKESMMWEAAGPMVNTEDPLLQGFLIAALGEARAIELLTV